VQLGKAPGVLLNDAARLDLLFHGSGSRAYRQDGPRQPLGVLKIGKCPTPPAFRPFNRLAKLLRISLNASPLIPTQANGRPDCQQHPHALVDTPNNA
jgi:hypothetical protein